MAIAMQPCPHPGRPAASPGPRVRARVDRPRRRAAARFRRRRRAAAVAVAGLVGAGVLVADTLLTGPGGVPASAAGAATDHVGRGMVVRAHPGDSLWSIAEEHSGEIPIQRYVEVLIDLNGGTRIEVGQLVRLP
jgi:hypothetical protein